MTKLQKILLYTTLILAFIVRLHKIDNPIADWHSWRQADTSAVTRNFVKYGLDPIHPRFDDLSSTPSGLDNPQGWRMVEFPIYNIVHYAMYTYMPDLSPTTIAAIGDYWRNSTGYNPPPLPTTSLEFYGRLTTAISSIITIVFIFLIVRYYSGYTTALLSAALYSFIPYSIFYSRVILPDPMMVTFALGTIWFFIKWQTFSVRHPERSETKSKDPSRIITSQKVSMTNYTYFTISLLMAICALLLKPTAIFLLALLPILAFQHQGTKIFTNKPLYLFGILAVIPLLWWRLYWIPQYPEGIAANSWLLNGDGIRLRPAWFRWLMYERVGLLILGGFGLIPFILGIIHKHTKPTIYLPWLLLSLLYLVIFATGNVKHDYYQIPIIPIICIYVAKGLIALWNNPEYNSWLAKPAAIFIIAMTMFISWYNVRGYYQINNPAIIHAGRWANERLPQDAKVIAPYQGDTAFLYQTNRAGWPIMAGSIEDMIQKGATYYVSTTNDATTKDLITRYQVLTFDPEVGIYIIELQKPK